MSCSDKQSFQEETQTTRATLKGYSPAELPSLEQMATGFPLLWAATQLCWVFGEELTLSPSHKKPLPTLLQITPVKLTGSQTWTLVASLVCSVLSSRSRVSRLLLTSPQEQNHTTQFLNTKTKDRDGWRQILSESRWLRLWGGSEIVPHEVFIAPSALRFSWARPAVRANLLNVCTSVSLTGVNAKLKIKGQKKRKRRGERKGKE